MALANPPELYEDGLFSLEEQRLRFRRSVAAERLVQRIAVRATSVHGDVMRFAAPAMRETKWDEQTEMTSEDVSFLSGIVVKHLSERGPRERMY